MSRRFVLLCDTQPTQQARAQLSAGILSRLRVVQRERRHTLPPSHPSLLQAPSSLPPSSISAQRLLTATPAMPRTDGKSRSAPSPAGRSSAGSGSEGPWDPDELVTVASAPAAAAVSERRRTALFTLASLHVILCSGTAYGWTALRPVLINNGMFSAFPGLSQSRKVSGSRAFKAYARLSPAAPNVVTDSCEYPAAVSPIAWCWRRQTDTARHVRARLSRQPQACLVDSLDYTLEGCHTRALRPSRPRREPRLALGLFTQSVTLPPPPPSHPAAEPDEYYGHRCQRAVQAAPGADARQVGAPRLCHLRRPHGHCR